MNTVKIFTTIHLQLNQTNVFEVVILSMAYLLKYVFQKKPEDLNLRVLSMITWINESKTLAKHISCECKCKFDGRNSNSDQWWNNRKCLCECKKRNLYEKDYVWNPATCNCENVKYLASIMDDSVIMFDEIIEKIVPTNIKWKRAACKTQHFYILFTILINYYSILDNC